MNSNSQPLVSVVTPVYNTEAYLAECIESVLAQTYENWEYVIVNNCSTDRSLEIAQHYAQQDARIRVHNNDEFLNQFQNWNRAMRQISPVSKYCKVLHADDWLFPECITRMVKVAEDHPSVGIVSAYRLDETRVKLDGLPYPSTVIPGHEICRLKLLGGPVVFGSPTSLLIRSDIVRSREPFYDESVIHTDTGVCFDILQNYDFGFVHQVLTFTRRYNESLTSITNRFNTRLVSRFIFFLKYGPVYLNKEEYERQLEKMLKERYTFLAKSVFELKGREFWEYHRNELKRLGYPLSVPKMTKALILELSNLERTFHRVHRAIQEKKRGTSTDVQSLDAVLSTIYSRED